jgi:hypothetical protein
MATPNRQLEPGRTTLFAALWLVKAWNALGDEPLVADTVGGRSSKLNLDVEGGGGPW